MRLAINRNTFTKPRKCVRHFPVSTWNKPTKQMWFKTNLNFGLLSTNRILIFNHHISPLKGAKAQIFGFVKQFKFISCTHWNKTNKIWPQMIRIFSFSTVLRLKIIFDWCAVSAQKLFDQFKKLLYIFCAERSLWPDFCH